MLVFRFANPSGDSPLAAATGRDRRIDDVRVDVVSAGGFIEAGTPITVTRVDGNRIVVRPLLPRQEPPHD